MGLQFIYSPKYSVYTYAAFEFDNNFLLTIFTLHEMLFMYNAWNGYLSIVILSSINAVELTTILEGMTNCISTTPFLPSDDIEATFIKDFHHHIQMSKAVAGIKEEDQNNNGQGHKSQLNYGIDGLILDYKKLMLISELLNSWCSYRIIGIHTIGYCQFITDVFIMIQLAKLPHTDWVAVMWFGEDALVGQVLKYKY